MNDDKEETKRFVFSMRRSEFERLETVCAELDIKIAQFLRSLIRKELKEILGAHDD